MEPLAKPILPSSILMSPDFIVQRFFSNEKNLQLLYAFLDNQSLQSWTTLEKEFRKFYFEVRFSTFAA
jgi:hypothetical protein